MIQRFVYATLQKEFIHQYKDAPEEVAYLRYPHRHVAHIKVKVEVYHNEREIEFIMLKHQLENFVNLTNLTNNSCETIAENILNYIKSYYDGNRDITITVSEDAENGCELVWTKEI